LHRSSIRVSARAKGLFYITKTAISALNLLTFHSQACAFAFDTQARSL
jgi:hypothetical protein